MKYKIIHFRVSNYINLNVAESILKFNGFTLDTTTQYAVNLITVDVEVRKYFLRDCPDISQLEIYDIVINPGLYEDFYNHIMHPTVMVYPDIQQVFIQYNGEQKTFHEITKLQSDKIKLILGID